MTPETHKAIGVLLKQRDQLLASRQFIQGQITPKVYINDREVTGELQTMVIRGTARGLEEEIARVEGAMATMGVVFA